MILPLVNNVNIDANKTKSLSQNISLNC